MESITITPKNEFYKVKEIIKNANAFVQKQTAFDKIFLIFWLCGPFILLVERSPADIWISLIALAYLIKGSVKASMNKKISKFAMGLIALLICGFVSASFSQMPLYSMLEMLAWVRFPLFALALTHWLAKNRIILEAYMVSLFFAMLLMFGILSAELVIEGHKNWGRLEWPFGDTVSGNYLAKVGLPSLIFACFYCEKSNRLSSRVISLLYITAFLLFSIACGERLNFLISFCSITLCIFFMDNRWRNLTILVGVIIVSLFLVNLVNETTFHRFGTAFLTEIPINPDSGYYKTMLPAFQIFQSNMLLGIGPGNYRFLCVDLLNASSLAENYCNNHPHNFYMQLLVETGIAGFISGCLFFIFTVTKCLATPLSSIGQTFESHLFIVPLAFFCPFAMHSDLFGQWNNIFIWHSIGLSMAYVHTRIGKRAETVT
jgi:O-antigen ligase